MVTLSGERLTSRLRVQLFKAMLQQSVGWHDEEEHTTGSLTTILSNDADNVKNVCLSSTVFYTHDVISHMTSCSVYPTEPNLTFLQGFALCEFIMKSIFLQGTGIRLGTGVLATLSVLLTLVICLATSWELTLVLMFSFPLMFVSIHLSYKIVSTNGPGVGKCLETSTHLVTETVKNIKTVFSHNAMEYFIQRSSHLLHSHML